MTDIRSRRIELGIRLRDLAKRAGVEETALRRWERGLELPDAKAASELALVLGVEARSILVAQEAHAATATPGEGYTTSEPDAGTVVARAAPPPLGKYRVLDLFCGAGGLSFGIEATGAFVTVGGVDLLRDRIDSFVANHAHAVGVAGDLRTLTGSMLRRIIGEVDVVVGGPPCQGFSSIRPFRNLTEGDPRNSLVEHYVLVIHELRPRWFVFENVVGILTHRGGTRLQSVLDGLRSAEYLVDWRVINAAHLGVPQFRERVVIVGSRDGVRFNWPQPTHRAEHKSMAGGRPEVLNTEPLFHGHLPPAIRLMDAISDLPPIRAGGEASSYLGPPTNAFQARMRQGVGELTLHRATAHSERMLNIIRHAGANRAALPVGMVKSGFSSCYSRLDADSPSTTLTVNFVHPASNRCIHPTQDRALTPREGARLQSFPDRFVFRGTSAQVVKQIGNAVPPMLGERLAQAILDSEDACRSRRPQVAAT